MDRFPSQNQIPVADDHVPSNSPSLNTIPTHINIIPTSRNQSINTSSSNNQQHTTHHDSFQTKSLLPCDNTKNLPKTTVEDTNLIRVYHGYNSNYIIHRYCQPVADSFDISKEICKYTRDCVVNKNKILKKSSLLESLSPTCFDAVPNKKTTSNYSVNDLRIVRCFSPSCKSIKTKRPKLFHYVCFMHMLNMNEDTEMKLIGWKEYEQQIKKQVDSSVDMNHIQNSLTNDNTNLIFPFCGIRCFRSIVKPKKEESEYSIIKSWDNDGTSKSKSSIKVLIEWITTEENCSSYFGGLDATGRTNANRKETYHYHIRDLIIKENGEFIFVLIYIINS